MSKEKKKGEPTVPFMFKLSEFIPERPGDAYMTRSTGSAGREDDYDD